MAISVDTREMLYAVAAAVAVGVGAACDVRTRRIPNRLTGGALASGLGLHLWLGGPRGLGGSALAGLAAGGTLLVFYLAGGMGAGDVKLMAAAGCLGGWVSVQPLLLGTALCGALMAVGIALWHGALRQTLANTWMLAAHHQARGLTAHNGLNVQTAGGLRMPFGVPIAGGCLLALGLQIWKG